MGAATAYLHGRGARPKESPIREKERGRKRSNNKRAHLTEQRGSGSEKGEKEGRNEKFSGTLARKRPAQKGG